MLVIDKFQKVCADAYLFDTGLMIVPKKKEIPYYVLSFQLSFPEDKTDTFNEILKKSEKLMLSEEITNYILQSIEEYEQRLAQRINSSNPTEIEMWSKGNAYTMIKRDLIEFYGIPYQIEMLRVMNKLDDELLSYHKLRQQRLEERLKNYKIKLY